jgi:hypothetical protein
MGRNECAIAEGINIIGWSKRLHGEGKLEVKL